MVVAWLSGLLLVWIGGFGLSGWFHGKLVLVVAMSGMHGYFAFARKRIAERQDIKSPRFYRVINEIPTMLMVGIVVLVIIKPF